MQITLLSKAIPIHQPGGLEKHTLDVILGLCNRDYQITLLTTAKPENFSEQQLPRHSNLKTIFCPKGKSGAYNRDYFKFLKQYFSNFENQKKYDLIHAQEFAALYLNIDLKIPLITTIHGTLDSETPLASHIFNNGSFFQKLKWTWQYKHRILIKYQYKKLLENSNHLIVDSQFTKYELIKSKVDQNKITVVPLATSIENTPPPDQDQISKTVKADQPYILTVSRLTWVKSLELGIKAFAKTNQSHQYVILGDGPEKPKLQQLTNFLGLQDKVIFLSGISEKELPAYYAGADLILMPEINQPAFGLVALEANLMQTSVLASKTGALPEVIQETGGWYFERGNVEDCSRKLQDLLSNPQKIKEIGINARKIALKQFSTDKMISDLEKVYQEFGKMQDHIEA